MEYPVKKIYKRNLFIIECRFIFYKYTSFLLYDIWIIYSFALDWTWRWSTVLKEGVYSKKKFLYIIELFAGSYRNICCRYIKKCRKKFGGKSESSYFCTRFSGERGSNRKKRDFFWRIRMKPLDLQSVSEWEKQAILEEITIDKKSSTRRVKVSVTSQQVV